MNTQAALAAPSQHLFLDDLVAGTMMEQPQVSPSDWAEIRRTRYGFLPPVYSAQMRCELTRLQLELLPTGKIIPFITGTVPTQNFNILNIEADPFGMSRPPTMTLLEIHAASLLNNFLREFAATDMDNAHNMGAIELQSIDRLPPEDMRRVFAAVHTPFSYQDYHVCQKNLQHFSLHPGETDCAHCRLQLLESGAALDRARAWLTADLYGYAEKLNAELLRSYRLFDVYARNLVTTAAAEVRENLASNNQSGLQAFGASHRHYLRHIHGDEPLFSAAQVNTRVSEQSNRSEERIVDAVVGAFSQLAERAQQPPAAPSVDPSATDQVALIGQQMEMITQRDQEITRLRAELEAAKVSDPLKATTNVPKKTK